MSKKKYFILLSVPFLASCGGFSTDYIVQGNKYNSPIFTENYYRHWDSELKKATIKDSHDVTASKIMSYSDIGLVDKNLLVENPYPYLSMYAEANNLMKADQSFYYGVQSKLFDGETICEGYYQKRRVQSDQTGFSVRFQKESDELNYFAMQFKATTNNQYDCYPVGAYLPNYAKDIGKVGDIYIDVSDWTYYVKVSSGAKGWIISGGINNPNRMTGLSSENAKESALFAKGVPTNIGEDNNVYIDMNTLDYYKKDSGSWIKLGTLLLDGVNKDGSVFTCYCGPEEHDRAIYHNSSFTMNITIYTKESSKIVGHSYTSEIVLDNYSTNNGDAYRFFAFSLQDYSLSRMVGFSVTFDNLNDDLVEWNKNKTIDGKAVPSIDYALFIYEVFLPYTYWH